METGRTGTKGETVVIIVTGHLQLTPEALHKLKPAMRAALEATRKEDGCLLYAFGEDVLEPGTIRIVERWRDWSALDAHGKAPHMGPYREAIAAAGGTLGREVIAHEAGEEKPL